VPARDPAGRMKVDDVGAARDEPPHGSGIKDQETTGSFDEPDRDEAEALAPGLLERLGAGLRALAAAVLFLMPPYASRARRSRSESPRSKAKR